MSSAFQAHTDSEDCEECWTGFPIVCDECGGGLKHAEFFDAGWDFVSLLFLCSACGDRDDPY